MTTRYRHRAPATANPPGPHREVPRHDTPLPCSPASHPAATSRSATAPPATQRTGSISTGQPAASESSPTPATASKSRSTALARSPAGPAAFEIRLSDGTPETLTVALLNAAEAWLAEPGAAMTPDTGPGALASIRPAAAAALTEEP